MTEIERFKKKIRQDKRYRGVRNLFKTSEIFQLPLDEYRSEVRSLFKLRKIRSFTISGTKSMDKLAESIVQDQSFRSRMTEIYAHLSESSRTLQDLLKRFHDYAVIEYARDLKVFGAAADRTAAIKSVLEPYLKYSDESRLLMEEIDMYLKDIDKAGFAFKSLVETLSLISQREYGLPTPKRKDR